MKTFYNLFLILPLLALCSCEKPDSFFASGTFETVETVVSSEVSGKLLKFDIEEGKKVEAEKPIAQVDDKQFRLQKQNLEAQIAALRNATPEVALQLSALEEKLSKQNAEKLRTERLIASKSANQKALDDIVHEIKYLENTISASKSTLDKTVLEISEKIKALNAQIEICDDNISKSKIVNPVDGIVLVKYAEPNEIVSFGKPLYKIGNLNELRLRAYISGEDITKLKIGQKLTIVADFGDEQNKKYEGTLIWVSEQSEFTPKGIRTRKERSDLVYAVKIAVKNDGLLKIGQYAEVEIPDDK